MNASEGGLKKGTAISKETATFTMKVFGKEGRGGTGAQERRGEEGRKMKKK